jgi:serine/threonine protein kinase
LITDFGSSKISDAKFLTTVKKSMTYKFASLEQLNCEKSDPSFDIWALGIILYYLMAKKLPYPEESDI